MKITIEQINYFGSATGTQDFNAKMLYRRNGKLHLAHIFIDMFNENIYEGRNNPKEHKLYKGALEAAKELGNKTNWLFN